MSAKWEVLNPALPFRRFGGESDQLKVSNDLANCAMKLVREDKTGKGDAISLAGVSKGFEADVLGNKHPAERFRPFEQGGVVEPCGVIFLSGDDVHAMPTELIADGGGNVNVKIERRQAACFRRMARSRRRRSEGGAAASRSSSSSSRSSSESISSR